MAGQSYYNKVDDFCNKLRQRRIDGSLEAAKGTAELMRQLVTSSAMNDPHVLLEEVRRVGIQIQSAKPIELVIGNIVRRVLHIIREEMAEVEEEQSMDLRKVQEPVAGGLSQALGNRVWITSRTFSLHNLLDNLPDAKSPAGVVSLATTPKRGKQKIAWERKPEVIDGVNELIDELKEIDYAIALHAPEHIHANELILTYGYSRTVTVFLEKGYEKRDFQVVVTEGAPTFEGQSMAEGLAKAGIQTTIIGDASVYAMMSRINKVVISAHALLADGGIMAPVGTAMVAAAAKRHSVPVVVLVGIYKLSPQFPHEPGVTFNDFKGPAAILPYTDETIVAAAIAAEEHSGEKKKKKIPFLQIHNPSYDYVPPHHISLFLTDHGHGFMPSYVYRQLSEFYHRQDYQLSKDLDAALSN